MKKGTVISLAWPATLCKQAGSWYDMISSLIGLSKNGYYKVGHSALILVDHEDGHCRYFDFGRYHAPVGHGRVRSKETDHDLHVETKARLDPLNNSIRNIQEILRELYHNPSTHGDGEIFGSVTQVDYHRTLNYIVSLQNRDHIEYGPFVMNGTNCSRFVSNAILAGNPELRVRIGLHFPLTVSPTPMWNLRATQNPIFRFGGMESVQQSSFNTEPIMGELIINEPQTDDVPFPITIER